MAFLMNELHIKKNKYKKIIVKQLFIHNIYFTFVSVFPNCEGKLHPSSKTVNVNPVVQYA